MKIAIVNTYAYKGGASRAANRLYQGLTSMGSDVKMIVTDDKSDDKNIIPIKKNSTLDFLFMGGEFVLLSAIRTKLSNTLFSLGVYGHDITKMEAFKEADIINLHWTCKQFLSIKNIKKILDSGKEVVFTLHDMWQFTGGCHYSAGCNRYQEQCKNCPQLTTDPFKIIDRLFQEKYESFNRDNLTIVTPSVWLSSCAKQSKIFGNLRVEAIANSLETDIFTPTEKSIAKKELDIDKNVITILFGTMNHSERRKGFEELLAALSYCKENPLFMEMANSKKILIMTFGKPSDDLADSGLPIKSVGFIKDDRVLSLVYSSADFLVLPSLEDNLPNIMIESLSCNTPVVAFDTGGIADVVKNNINGLLSKTGDERQLAENIVKMTVDSELRERLIKNSRSSLGSNFELASQGKNYLNLFEELLKKDKNINRIATIKTKNSFIVVYIKLFFTVIISFLTKPFKKNRA